MKRRVLSSVDHYENFPVASLLVPAGLRPAVLAIYRFAREADDIADEGDRTDDERICLLTHWDRALRDLGAPGRPPAPPAVEALAPVIARHRLPVQALCALLDAFMQDVRTRRYADRDAVADYCRRSANPIGQIMLRLFEADTAENLECSDRICTALQLINFLQDIAIDWHKGRVYLPQDRLREHGLSDADIEHAVCTRIPRTELLAAIADEATHARSTLLSGASLIENVPIRLSLELRAILAGGLRILDRLHRQRHDIFTAAPRLGWRDTPALLRLYLRPAA